ncbi:unnamed protein product, partial [Candidula unifasciata]
PTSHIIRGRVSRTIKSQYTWTCKQNQQVTLYVDVKAEPTSHIIGGRTSRTNNQSPHHLHPADAPGN